MPYVTVNAKHLHHFRAFGQSLQVALVNSQPDLSEETDGYWDEHILIEDITFPANRHSAPCCRLDTSLLSAGDQGAKRRSARKVMRRTPCEAFAPSISATYF